LLLLLILSQEDNREEGWADADVTSHKP